MHDTSAQLVERVLPAASYRQWVLTVPFPLRLRIARGPGELSRVLNLFHRALRAELRRRARRLGLRRHRTRQQTVSALTRNRGPCS